MAPTGTDSVLPIQQAAQRSRTQSMSALGNNSESLLDTIQKPCDDRQDDDEEEEEEDRDDKSWRTRGESSPSLMASPARSFGGDSFGCPPRWWDVTDDNNEHHPKRQLFWRNIMRQYNFVDQAHEQALVLSLTQGIDWTTMAVLPAAFMARQKEIYYLLCRADYARSSMIQRDVTRTFSIFERSQLPRRERDVNAQQRALFRVLNAVAEAEDGYCQGMNFIAALFLVEGLDEADAYALFLYLLQKRQLARIYHHSSTFLDDYLDHFDRLLQSELPDLHAHLQAQGFAIPMYGIEWFTTLFSLSTKPDLACAIFDLFFVGVQDIFLRMGLAILTLLEAPLLCMSFEDFLRDFKPLVRQIDPYHAILKALAMRPNPHVAVGEDTTAHIARLHYQRVAAQGNVVTTVSGDTIVCPPRAFLRHRSLPPELGDAIAAGDLPQVALCWQAMTALRDAPLHSLVLANEMLHFAVWHGHVTIAVFAIRQCGADVDNADDTGLTPLHFAVLQNQPDIVRLLLCCGADAAVCGGRWSGATAGLTPHETALHWKFRDTTAARLVLEREVCLCCNTKLETFAFAFHRATCRQCTFTYCGRGSGSAPCIQRHQCPAVYRQWRQHRQRPQDDEETDASLVGGETVEVVVSGENDSSAGSAPSSVSSRRSSRSTSTSTSTSDTLSSSFVYINSPASDLSLHLSLDRMPSASTTTTEGVTTTTTHDTASSTGLLNSLVDWFSGVTTTASAVNDDGLVDQASHNRSIDFPDHPEWYCNAPDCHAVFAFFFSRADECTRCHGFFCANDYDARTQQCRHCCRL